MIAVSIFAGALTMTPELSISGRPRILLAAYPFQKYGMLTGKVTRISADATESGRAPSDSRISNDAGAEGGPTTSDFAVDKERVQFDAQVMCGSHGEKLPTSPGMQVVAEINQGNRTALESLLSPVQKAVREAGRQRGCYAEPAMPRILTAYAVVLKKWTVAMRMSLPHTSTKKRTP